MIAYNQRVSLAREQNDSASNPKDEPEKEGGEIELKNFYDTSSCESKCDYDVDDLSDPGSSIS